MLLGMSLSLIVLLAVLTDRFRAHGIASPCCADVRAAITWGIFWTWMSTPHQAAAGRPKPLVVERFAAGVDDFLEGKGGLSFLWYDNWNLPIIRYYQSRNSSGTTVAPYVGPHFRNMWAQADVSGVPKAEILEGILAGVKEVFAQPAPWSFLSSRMTMTQTPRTGSTGIAMIGFHG